MCKSLLIEIQGEGWGAGYDIPALSWLYIFIFFLYVNLYSTYMLHPSYKQKTWSIEDDFLSSTSYPIGRIRTKIFPKKIYNNRATRAARATRALAKTGWHPTPRIGLSVRPSVRPSGKNTASWTHASLIRVKDHWYMHHLYLHHTHIHQDQGSYIFTSWIHASCKYSLGSRIIDMCIIHTCIRVKDRGS